MPRTTEQVKKSIFSEVKLIYAVVIIVLAVAFWLWSDQKTQDIQIIKLQASIDSITTSIKVLRDGDLKDLKADILENRSEISSLKEEVIKLITVINERIPARK